MHVFCVARQNRFDELAAARRQLKANDAPIRRIGFRRARSSAARRSTMPVRLPEVTSSSRLNSTKVKPPFGAAREFRKHVELWQREPPVFNAAARVAHQQVSTRMQSYQDAKRELRSQGLFHGPSDGGRDRPLNGHCFHAYLVWRCGACAKGRRMSARHRPLGDHKSRSTHALGRQSAMAGR